MLENHKYFAQTEWGFTIYTRQHVRDLYQKIKNEDVTEALQQAYEQELELVEICHGDYRNLACFPLTPDINLEVLKLDWCRTYCKAHDFYLAVEP